MNKYRARTGMFLLNASLLLVLQINSVLAQGDESNQSASEDWVKDEILQQLMELRKEMKSIRKELADVKSSIENLGRRRTATAPKEVLLNSSIQFGDSSARLAIVEFTDYQCPYCARHSKTVFPEIKQKLVDTGRVRYVMYDFPLGFHRQAKSAAVAARCAGRQGRYLDMHDALFQNQRALSEDFYLATAQKLSLNESSFTQCLGDPGVTSKVEANMDYGSWIGVSGTPKFFIGKVKNDVITDVIVISGAQGFSVFNSAIKRLEKM